MSKTCPECGSELRAHVETVGRFTVEDGTVSGTRVCASQACGWGPDLRGDVLQGFELRAARLVLLERQDADGAVYRFARKAMGLRQVDVAALLDVAPETVSRWETDAKTMERATQLALAALLGQALGGADMRALAGTQGAPTGPAETVLRVVSDAA